MNKIEDKKKLPMVLDVLNPPKINLEKKYYEDLKEYQAVILSGGPNNIGESQRLNFDKKIC